MKTIVQWIERDLTAAARANQLEPAYGVDDTVQEIAEILEAGAYPVLVGESGVGKTAIVYELVRRAVAGNGPACLANRRIVQISLQRRAASLRHAHEMVVETQALLKALQERGRGLVLFIRDIHLAYRYDLEEQLCTLAYGFDGLVLGEGPKSEVDTLFEQEHGLQQYYARVTVDEPDLKRANEILTEWAQQRSEKGPRFTAGAVDQALNLTHRFLARRRLPRKALDLLRQTTAGTKNVPCVTGAHVIDRYCAAHRTPRVLVDPAIPLNLDRLRESLAKRVVGQVEAVNAVVDMIGAIKAGLTDPERPLGALLFVGPTGVGKTYLARMVAQLLFGGTDRLMRINMADFPNEADANVMFGDSNQHAVAQIRGLLTTRMAGHPFGVLLLDEFEKAHAKVHDRFLQLVDEGSFINGAGETVSCRSMVIIATSNAGAAMHYGKAFGFVCANEAAQLREVRAALETEIRFELLNRFDRIVHFTPLSRHDIRTVALRELRRIETRIGMNQHGMTLVLDRSIVDWIADRGYDPDYGARMLRRTVASEVVTAVADVIVSERPEAGSRIELKVANDKIHACILAGSVSDTATSPVGSRRIGSKKPVTGVGRGRRPAKDRPRLVTT